MRAQVASALQEAVAKVFRALPAVPSETSSTASRFSERPLPGIGAYIGRHSGYVIGRATLLGGGDGVAISGYPQVSFLED